MNKIIIYVTYSKKQIAKDISKLLLDKKLISCANIFSNVESMFNYDNKINLTSEFVVLYKTIETNYIAIEKLIKKHHEYDTPCILSIKIDNGEKNFLKWIEFSTNDAITN